MAQEQYDWSRYFDAVHGQPPRETLLYALGLFDAEQQASQSLNAHASPSLAIDLGCGDGRDTLELLHRGWRVLAIDSSDDAIKRLLDKAPLDDLNRLEARVQRFQDARLPPARLVCASFSIPHCDPAEFPLLWKQITGCLVRGGRFAGQLFGPRDSWATNPDGLTRTYHSRERVDELLTQGGLVTEKLDEIERPGVNAFGEPKHWHVFHIVARKR